VFPSLAAGAVWLAHLFEGYARLGGLVPWGKLARPLAVGGQSGFE
jgi:hypothetical protein